MMSYIYIHLQLSRNASSLVVVEHNGEAVNPITYNAISAAKQLGGDVTALVAGDSCTKVAEEMAKAEGVSKLLVAQHAGYKGFLPEALTPLLLDAQKQFNFTHLVAGASALGKVSVLLSLISQASYNSICMYMTICHVHTCFCKASKLISGVRDVVLQSDCSSGSGDIFYLGHLHVHVHCVYHQLTFIEMVEITCDLRGFWSLTHAIFL